MVLLVPPTGFGCPLRLTNKVDDFKVNATDVFSAKTCWSLPQGPLAVHWCNVKVLIKILPKKKKKCLLS